MPEIFLKYLVNAINVGVFIDVTVGRMKEGNFPTL